MTARDQALSDRRAVAERDLSIALADSEAFQCFRVRGDETRDEVVARLSRDLDAARTAVECAQVAVS